MPLSYLNGNLGYFVQLSYLDDSLIFPDPQSALSEPNGLLAVGGDLSADRLLSAYRQGIFPWFGDNEPILWWSPNPRAVLDPLQFHLSRSLKKFIKKCDYRVTLNYDFASVIQACAVNHDETWITSEMINAYIKLHQLGYAHSIEVWQDNNLIGGLYGVAQGALFCGELMFSLQTNASKIALYAFCLHFVNCGGLLLDCQVLNEHTESLGVFEISRADYLSYLSQLSMYLIADDCYHKQVLTYY